MTNIHSNRSPVLAVLAAVMAGFAMPAGAQSVTYNEVNVYRDRDPTVYRGVTPNTEQHFEVV